MKTDTSRKIIGYIQSKKQVSLKELIAHFEFSQQAVSKQLKKLVTQGLLSKTGRPPQVFYSLVEPKKDIFHEAIDQKFKKIIQERFLLITPIGEMKSGAVGFTKWCTERDLPIAKTAIEYARTLKKYDAFRRESLIDGMGKMRRTFSPIHLDHLYYLDFYSIDRFGKTKLGQMLLYAKQSQNRGFMKELINLIKPAIERLIKRYKIDAIGFIPPTVKREVQFMKELQRHLGLKVP
ncbi:MAG: winged helix-turn-helix domain-containing protein, partial [Candidatus Peregrinibacteria bacterium]